MRVIQATNVNVAWEKAKDIVNSNMMIERPSRNGKVFEYPEPVCTEYFYPDQRVLFDPVRNCNPYFHFFEGLWMLAGRNDVAFPARLAENIKNYAEDDGTMHGAYGYRWRKYFDLEGGAEEDFADQLKKVIRMLRKNSNDRRIVLGMWDPRADLEADKRDIPCNTQIYFYVRQGCLTMTVTCRSNDIVWGCYGANVVHMSMLHEYVSRLSGYPMGPYYQISNSWHVYEATKSYMKGEALDKDPYFYNVVSSYPLVDRDSTQEEWDDDLKILLSYIDSGRKNPNKEFKDPFFASVAYVLFESWYAYKNDDIPRAKRILEDCYAQDWKRACHEWLERIERKRENKNK